MTPPPDELRNLWNLDTGSGTLGAAELLRDIEKTASRFNRTIRFRDLRESAAGIVVAIIFAWFAIHDGYWLDRAAHVWLSACGVWIVFYLRRYSQASRGPLPDQSLMGYQRDLLHSYDRQIGLLRRAKYWYILPFWAGLALGAVAGLVRNGNLWIFGLHLLFVTAVNGGLWWLNERMGVAYLQNQRRQLLVRTGLEGVAE